MTDNTMLHEQKKKEIKTNMVTKHYTEKNRLNITYPTTNVRFYCYSFKIVSSCSNSVNRRDEWGNDGIWLQQCEPYKHFLVSLLLHYFSLMFTSVLIRWILFSIPNIMLFKYLYWWSVCLYQTSLIFIILHGNFVFLW